jgi:hypothetical protein
MTSQIIGLHLISIFVASNISSKVERLEMVEMLQRVSKKHKIRVTLIGGDVHLGAMGRFINSTDSSSLDFRLMYQITSSAIGLPLF